MPWLSDLASILGIPAGAVTLALGMYGLCAAAELAARKTALTDISLVLKDTSWERSVRPSAITERIFMWTFGQRHLSWKCISRSVLSTAIISVSFSVAVYLLMGRFFLQNVLGAPFVVLAKAAASIIIVAGVLPDYLALWKTRLLLRMFHGRPVAVLLLILDITLSMAISIICFFLWYLLFTHYFPLFPPTWNLYFPQWDVWQVMAFAGNALEQHILWLISPTPQGFAEFHPVLFSTLFTSIWTILIFLSTAVLKLASPIHRFTAWFFNVEEHPLQAIGMVSGALVMIGSLVLSLVRTAL